MLKVEGLGSLRSGTGGNVAREPGKGATFISVVNFIKARGSGFWVGAMTSCVVFQFVRQYSEVLVLMCGYIFVSPYPTAF